jgi:hypothetical protein
MSNISSIMAILGSMDYEVVSTVGHDGGESNDGQTDLAGLGVDDNHVRCQCGRSHFLFP